MEKTWFKTLKYKQLYCSDGVLPRAYAVPKTHKPECSFRIIISSIGSYMP